MPTILKALASKPFGVRAGVAPLLLALVMKMRAHELAIYENGAFKPSFVGQDATRLIKAPQTFEIQHCRIEGVRAEAFRRLAETFADPHPRTARPPELLDVVQPLCRFAARLPEYTRRAGVLSRRSAAVRDVLLSASEPATMLFKDLPLACGVEPFGLAAETDDGRSRDFVARLQEAVDELRADYPRLLRRIVSTAWEAIGGGKGFDRAALAARAARASLTASQPRLRTFALRLRDPGTSDDAWAEALASYVVSKPPSRWNGTDEGRWFEELAALADLFRKVEAAAFGEGRSVPDRAAVRINLTRADGEDHVRIIESRARDVVHQKCFEAMDEMLPSDRQMRMRVLIDLLWEEMAAPAAAKAPPAKASNRTGGSEAP
ncbi:hypothetical protein [Methylobacterium nigriterrae]|uniref:hypothetical protein n=1 Tax=Methylobacterium nigriterrae TaxID=3127512 RepID=UPI003013A4B0